MANEYDYNEQQANTYETEFEDDLEQHMTMHDLQDNFHDDRPDFSQDRTISIANRIKIDQNNKMIESLENSLKNGRNFYDTKKNKNLSVREMEKRIFTLEQDNYRLAGYPWYERPEHNIFKRFLHAIAKAVMFAVSRDYRNSVRAAAIKAEKEAAIKDRAEKNMSEKMNRQKPSKEYEKKKEQEQEREPETVIRNENDKGKKEEALDVKDESPAELTEEEKRRQQEELAKKQAEKEEKRKQHFLKDRDEYQKTLGDEFNKSYQELSDEEKATVNAEFLYKLATDPEQGKYVEGKVRFLEESELTKAVSDKLIEKYREDLPDNQKKYAVFNTAEKFPFIAQHIDYHDMKLAMGLIMKNKEIRPEVEKYFENKDLFSDDKQKRLTKEAAEAFIAAELLVKNKNTVSYIPETVMFNKEHASKEKVVNAFRAKVEDKASRAKENSKYSEVMFYPRNIMKTNDNGRTFAEAVFTGYATDIVSKDISTMPTDVKTAPEVFEKFKSEEFSNKLTQAIETTEREYENIPANMDTSTVEKKLDELKKFKASIDAKSVEIVAPEETPKPSLDEQLENARKELESDREDRSTAIGKKTEVSKDAPIPEDLCF